MRSACSARRDIVMLSGVVLFVSALTSWASRDVRSSEDIDVSVPLEALSLGTLIENSTIHHTLTLLNHGSRAVTVEAVDGLCDWNKSGVVFPLVIPERGSHDLKLTLTPSPISPCGRAKSGELYSPTVTVRLSAGGRAVQKVWQLRGQLKPLLYIDGGGGLMRLGEQTDAQLAEPREVRLVASAPVDAIAIRTDGTRWGGSVRLGSAAGRFVATVWRVGSPQPGGSTSC